MPSTKVKSEGFTLESLLDASGKRMREDLAERLVSHPGAAGVNREEIIRQFLRKYLPKRFEVSHGFAFDANGSVSRQLDVIISNALISPHFETAGGVRFFPCESIVAVGQVKSSLSSAAELGDALMNLESAKSLDRSAKGRAVDLSYGEAIDPTKNHLHQIFTFIFIAGRAPTKDLILHELMDKVHHSAPHLWPNVVLANGKYLATFCCGYGVCPNPMDARGIAIQDNSPEHDILMKFYLLLAAAIEVTRVCGLPYWQYLEKAKLWSADVHYSCADYPPPLLSSLGIY